MSITGSQATGRPSSCEYMGTVSHPLRVGTRGSALAVTQTRQVMAALQACWPGLVLEMVTIATKGDLVLDSPLHQVGGKGLFVKEIEEALLANHVDLAVHSAKDLPAEVPPGLAIGCYPRRVDPRDALIARDGLTLDTLPQGARVGTSSLRRVYQLRHLRPDLQVEPLRGNVDTRLRKLSEGQYDAILLAAAGLTRLGLAERVTEFLDPGRFIPAVGQGALALEVRLGDQCSYDVCAALNDVPTATAVIAERAFLARVEGGCQVPAGAYARVEGDHIHLDGFLAGTDGSFYAVDAVAGRSDAAADLGRTLAERLLVHAPGGTIRGV